MEPVEITITRGLPFSRTIRVTGGKNIWPNLVDFEVRSHLRKKKDPTSLLILVLHDYMEKSYGVDTQADDIIITWTMTGAETLEITDKGYFDVLLSDPGADDERGLRAVMGSIKLEDLTTTTEG